MSHMFFPRLILQPIRFVPQTTSWSSARTFPASPPLPPHTRLALLVGAGQGGNGDMQKPFFPRNPPQLSQLEDGTPRTRDTGNRCTQSKRRGNSWHQAPSRRPKWTQGRLQHHLTCSHYLGSLV